MVADGISSGRRIVWGHVFFLNLQVYSGKVVKIAITLEADHNVHRCMKMLQLAVIAVSNEKINTKACDKKNKRNTTLDSYSL